MRGGGLLVVPFFSLLYPKFFSFELVFIFDYLTLSL